MGGDHVQVRRIYEEPGAAEGRRVLVDRLWPRGVSKDSGLFDEWVKEAAPSDELRRWYGHRPERFREFSRRYRDELRTSPAKPVVDALVAQAGKRPLTLLTATRDLEHSGATVLSDHLRRRLR